MEMKKLVIVSLLTCLLLANCQTAKKPSSQPAPGMPYRLSEISYRVDDNQLQKAVNRARRKSVFKEGQPYSIYDFDKERKRLLALLEKKGVKDLNWRQISFEVDTTLADQQFSVIAVINTKK